MQNLHVAAADGAPGLDSLVTDLAQKFGVAGASPSSVAMDDNNTDWNPLYLFSSVCRSDIGHFFPPSCSFLDVDGTLVLGPVQD